MTDLEDRIRDALRTRAAETVPTRDSIGARSPRRAWVAPLLAAVVVIALAATVAVVAAGRRHGTTDDGLPAAGGEFYVGSTWRVVSLHDHDGPLTVPDRLDATITYESDGALIADDTVNTLSGHYTVGDETYTVRDAASTLVGTDGQNRDQVRVQTALAKLFFVVSTGTPDPDDPAVVVRTEQSGGRLVLHTVGEEIITVELVRVGGAPAPDTAAPSRTSTRTP